MAAGGRFFPTPGALLRMLVEVAMALPVAVPPLTVMASIAEFRAERSVVGDCSTRALSLNASSPMFTRFGTFAAKLLAARLAAARRVGFTSVAVIDPDTSLASMIDARSIGTATVRCGLAAATISAAIAMRNTSIGRWRRKPGRVGATEAWSAGEANAAAATRRPR